MKLKVRRSQKNGLMGKVIFMLDVMAEFAPEERALIDKYKLRGEVVYAHSRALQNSADAVAGDVKALGGALLDRVTKRVFTVGDLMSGQHIECKSLSELIDAEEQVHSACQEMQRYLSVATSFDGSEAVFEIAV